MKINFKEFSGKKKEIYEFLWNKESDFEVAKKGKKDISYEFTTKENTIESMIDMFCTNFKITNKELFATKFLMACSGSGNEIDKITTMHSSSLLALLSFFSVTEKNKLTIPGLDGYVFEKSFFEFKNKVISYPSNVDVVLLGKNKNGKKVILFLESKFTEYITRVTKKGSKYKVGKSYFKDGTFIKPIYDKVISEFNLELEKNKLIPSEDKYIEGIKQMISHYYGIRNFIDKQYCETNNDSLKEILDYNAEEILLGEILFDNIPDSMKSKYLEPYKSDYSKLAKIMNDQLAKDNITNFKVLENFLRYTDLINFVSNLSEVKNYYFENL